MDKQQLISHELAGTTTAFFCARNSSALYQQVLRIDVQNDKTNVTSSGKLITNRFFLKVDNLILFFRLKINLILLGLE